MSEFTMGVIAGLILGMFLAALIVTFWIEIRPEGWFHLARHKLWMKDIRDAFDERPSDLP